MSPPMTKPNFFRFADQAGLHGCVRLRRLDRLPKLWLTVGQAAPSMANLELGHSATSAPSE